MTIRIDTNENIVIRIDPVADWHASFDDKVELQLRKDIVAAIHSWLARQPQGNDDQI
jgi:putative heme degradation protein